MTAAVSVVIPALNEERCLAAAIDAAFAAGASEVLVADGGSADSTVAVARAKGAIIVEGQRMRARQMNSGAEMARHPVLLFVHADTILPAAACAAAAEALESGAAFGGFLLSFAESSRRLAIAASLINFRTRLTREPWGDQAQFVRRESFLAAGGYREVPLMEDYEFARRMRSTGRVAILPMRVRTSGRRFRQRGLLRTALTNWAIIAAWHLGVPPESLARWYRGTRSNSG